MAVAVPVPGQAARNLLGRPALPERERDLHPQTLGREGQFRPAVELVRGGELDQPGAETLPGRRPSFRATLLRPAQPETATAAARRVLAVLPAEQHPPRGRG